MGEPKEKGLVVLSLASEGRTGRAKLCGEAASRPYGEGGGGWGCARHGKDGRKNPFFLAATRATGGLAQSD